MNLYKKAYRVWWPGNGTAKLFESANHEEAAKRWAEWYDLHCDDYKMVHGEIIKVHVLCEGDDEGDVVEMRIAKNFHVCVDKVNK